MKFTFGKYKGQQLNNVTDRNYLEWLLENVEWLSDESKQAISNRLISLKPLSTKKGIPLPQHYTEMLNHMLTQDLSEWETNFVQSVLNYGHITEPQNEVVKGILKKLDKVTS